MKKLIYMLLLPMMVMVACGGQDKNKKDNALVLMQDSVDAHGLQRMQVSKSEVDITFKGKNFHSFISRTPGEELPHVVSELGDTYVDNQIVLRLTRGSEQVFNMTFTKNSFASVVEEAFLAKSILEGMVYNKTTPQGIVFAASICYPQTDLYVPVSITISADGKMSMVKEETIEDTYETDSL